MVIRRLLPIVIVVEISMTVIFLFALIRNVSQKKLVGCEKMKLFSKKENDTPTEPPITLEDVKSICESTIEHYTLSLAKSKSELFEDHRNLKEELETNLKRMVDNRICGLDHDVKNRFDDVRRDRVAVIDDLISRYKFQDLNVLYRILVFSIPSVQIYAKTLKEFRVNSASIKIDRLAFYSDSDYDIIGKVFLSLNGYSTFLKDQQAKKMKDESSIFDILNKKGIKYEVNNETISFEFKLPLW